MYLCSCARNLKLMREKANCGPRWAGGILRRGVIEYDKSDWFGVGEHGGKRAIHFRKRVNEVFEYNVQRGKVENA